MMPARDGPAAGAPLEVSQYPSTSRSFLNPFREAAGRHKLEASSERALSTEEAEAEAEGIYLVTDANARSGYWGVSYEPQQWPTPFAVDLRPLLDYHAPLNPPPWPSIPVPR